MKKIIWLVLVLVMLVALVACGNDAETTPAAPSDTTPEVTTSGKTEDKVEGNEWYTGTVNSAYTEAIKGGSAGVDTSAYEFFGAASDVTMQINNKYQNRKWFMEAADGTKTATDYQTVRKLSVIAAKVVKNGTDNEILVKEIDARVIPKYEKITAKAGAYIMLDFYSSIPATYSVTVTKTADGKSALYTERQIPVETDKKGVTTGLAKFTVPHTAGTTYYVNIRMGNATVSTVEVETVESSFPTNICQLWLRGCWEKVKDPDYLDKIIYEFYACYPQILARFAVKGDEPRAVTVYIEDTDGVAWAAGTEVGIGLGWVNEKTHHELNEIGFLSHELGHCAQQFAGKLNYGEDTQYDLNGDGVIDYKGEQVDGDEEWEAWFTEQMASYAGLRYYHWGTLPEAVDLEKLTPEHNYFFNFTGYGNCGVFFAYVDWYYPTIDKNGNGKVDDGERGLIDELYWVIKNTKSMIFDNPYDPNIIFNQTIQKITENKYKNFPEMYDDFVADMKSGAWVFTGFSDFKDNWLHENIPGVANPDYPVYKAAEHGNVTNEAKLQTGVKADTVVLPQGENIAKGSTVIQLSGKNNDKEGIEALFDGNLETNWRASQDGINGKYVLMSVAHGFIIDLGEVKTFDTYAFVNAGISKADTFNTSSWEVLVSTDGKNFTSIDYQEDKPADAVTVEVGTQSARYIEFRVYKTNPTSNGIVRINEMVFVKTK